MEATLPASATSNKFSSQSKSVGASKPTSGSESSPKTWLPLIFMLSGIAAIFTAVVWLTWSPQVLATYHYNPLAVAITHLVTLGWISSVIFGALYQLTPVTFQTQLHSVRFARYHICLHLVGVIGMVWMFFYWDPKQVGHFGSIVAFGILFFAYNIFRTIRSIPRFDTVALAIASSLVWLILTMTAGLYLAADKCWAFTYFDPLAQMHAHAHLGVIGFFLILLIGVSYKLLPMFILSEVRSQRRAFWSIILLNLAVPGVFLTILLKSRFKLLFAAMAAVAILVYLWEVARMLQNRKRRELDWGLIHFLTGLGLFAPLIALAFVLSWPRLPATDLALRLESAYGFLALFGVFSMAILGMLYKILPFLVWYNTYSNAIGRYRTPAVKDLYSPWLQCLGYWGYLVGVATTTTAIALAGSALLQVGTALMLFALICFALNVLQILKHLMAPQLTPLDLSKG